MIKNSIIKEYKKNGVVVLRDIISKKWIDILFTKDNKPKDIELEEITNQKYLNLTILKSIIIKNISISYE